MSTVTLINSNKEQIILILIINFVKYEFLITQKRLLNNLLNNTNLDVLQFVYS